MGCLLDTNILLRLFTRESASYETVVSAVERLRVQEEDLYFAPQNAAEFWNVATRPEDRNGFGLALREAGSLLDHLEQLFAVLPETPALYPAWRSLVRSVSVSGVQVHDARLVAWMQVHEVGCILTLNSDDFARYASHAAIEVPHPKDMAPMA